MNVLIRFWTALARIPTGQFLPMLLPVLGLHALMGVYDAYHPEVFLLADRATSRLDTIQQLWVHWGTPSLPTFLASQGNPGDYLPQGVLLHVLGRGGLITIQVLLALAAGCGVYRLARLGGLPERWSVCTALMYLLLPHTLVFAHQLASEAIHSPLVVLSTWLLVEAVQRPMGWVVHASSGVVASLAALVRPVTLLISALLMGALLASKRAPTARTAFVYMASSYFLVALWCGFMAWQAGSFGMGSSSRDLAHNLYGRAARMIEAMPAQAAAQARADHLAAHPQLTLSVAEYGSFTVSYPGTVALHTVRDATMFIAKSGVERLLIDYLHLNSGARAELTGPQGWRTIWETQGSVAALHYLWRTQGLVLVAAVLGSVAMMAMSGLAVLGAYKAIWAGPLVAAAGIDRRLVLLLALVSVYIFVMSLAVDAVQSRHRAPAEFAILLLAVVGTFTLRAWRQPSGATSPSTRREPGDEVQATGCAPPLH